MHTNTSVSAERKSASLVGAHVHRPGEVGGGGAKSEGASHGSCSWFRSDYCLAVDESSPHSGTEAFLSVSDVETDFPVTSVHTPDVCTVS